MKTISPTTLQKHSVTVAGHRTSITLETAFWDALNAIAKNRGLAVAALIAEIDGTRASDPADPNLSSAIRVYVLRQSGN